MQGREKEVALVSPVDTESLLDALGRVFAMAAVDQFIREASMLANPDAAGPAETGPYPGGDGGR